MKKRVLIVWALVILCASVFFACGKTEEIKCEHEFGEWETIAPATETEDGTQKRICSLCREEETGALYALGSSGLYYIVDPSNNTAKVSSCAASNAEEIFIPEYYNGCKVTGIGNMAFRAMKNIKRVHISSTVTDIEYRAFYWCEALESITIPASVTNIAKMAFVGCINLDSIEVEKGNTVYHSEGNCIIETQSKTLVLGCKTSVIPSDGSVTSIEAAFSGCKMLESIIIPESVNKIGQWSFSGCVNLTSIDIPRNVNVIEQDAFSGCGFSELVIPDHITKIDMRAFTGCEKLKRVVIPSSVTEIGISAFSDCIELDNIVIPDSITMLSPKLFFNCQKLKTVTIPSSVTSIGESVFYKCESLSVINYKGTKAQWEKITFGSNWNHVTPSYTVVCVDGTIEKS